MRFVGRVIPITVVDYFWHTFVLGFGTPHFFLEKRPLVVKNTPISYVASQPFSKILKVMQPCKIDGATTILFDM